MTSTSRTQGFWTAMAAEIMLYCQNPIVSSKKQKFKPKDHTSNLKRLCLVQRAIVQVYKAKA